jgi:hypothetical protein
VAVLGIDALEGVGQVFPRVVFLFSLFSFETDMEFSAVLLSLPWFVLDLSSTRNLPGIIL